jgi:hypothetical protein
MSVSVAPRLAGALVGIPVSFHGSRLGRTVDLLVDVNRWRALGFVVECEDDEERFLPLAASQVDRDAIEVGSPLMLLDDVGFYRARAYSARALAGAEIARFGRHAGLLADLVLAGTGVVDELELDVGGVHRRVPAHGSIVLPSTATAA